MPVHYQNGRQYNMKYNDVHDRALREQVGFRAIHWRKYLFITVDCNWQKMAAAAQEMAKKSGQSVLARVRSSEQVAATGSDADGQSSDAQLQRIARALDAIDHSLGNERVNRELEQLVDIYAQTRSK